jgi:hypothetical protein
MAGAHIIIEQLSGSKIKKIQIVNIIIQSTGLAGTGGINRLRHRSFKCNPALLGISIRIRNGF